MKYFLILTLTFLMHCKTDSEAKPDVGASTDKDLSLDGMRQTDLTSNDANDGGQKDANTKDIITQDCGAVEVVQFTTSDRVKLSADYHPPKGMGKGAVVLFHMIPPGNDRKGYPLRVRSAFADAGYAVLNVDRRGAGESEGVAKDAYTGPNGRLDVEAAVTFLLSSARKCASNPQKIMLVGASNGTTSVMDYTTGREDASLPDPAAIAWLSPGAYTEGQNMIADHKALFQGLPLLVIHPSSEPWINSFQGFSEKWKIITLDQGRHGTNNFDNGTLESQTLAPLIDWANTSIGD